VKHNAFDRNWLLQSPGSVGGTPRGGYECPVNPGPAA
jgi:hypothetical protein